MALKTLKKKIPDAALSELDRRAEPCHTSQSYGETPYQLAVSVA
jgi:hypothetical protein